MSSYLIKRINETRDDISNLKDLEKDLNLRLYKNITDTEFNNILDEIDDIGDKLGVLQHELETLFDNLRDEVQHGYINENRDEI